MIKRIVALACALLLALAPLAGSAGAGTYEIPEGYDAHDYLKLSAFLETENEEGVRNGEILYEDYDPDDPGTWTSAFWTEDAPKKLSAFTINLSESQVFGNLDLSGCSELIRVLAWNSGITGMDLSDCPKLTRAEVSGNLGLAELELSGCSMLTFVNASECALETLNLEGCVRLSELDLSYNGLTEIDLAGLPLLTKLYLTGNPLASIDLSNQRMLRELKVSGAPIGSLDVTSCPALESLHCDSCGLTELDLSRCAALRSISLSYNSIEEIDVTGCPRFESIQASHAGLKRFRTIVLELTAEGPGTVGLDFYWNDVHSVFMAYPDGDAEFLGWYNQDGHFSSQPAVEWMYAGSGNSVTARFAPELIPGDADQDGEVTVSDALLALRCSLNLFELADRAAEAADMNGDGAVTLTDALMILRTAMGLM